MSAIEIGDLLKGLTHKDLRIQCRARGLNPGGSREVLQERLAEHMMETSDRRAARTGSRVLPGARCAGPRLTAGLPATARRSLATEFNGDVAQVAHANAINAADAAAHAHEGAIGVGNNNYSRPQGQNVSRGPGWGVGHQQLPRRGMPAQGGHGRRGPASMVGCTVRAGRILLDGSLTRPHCLACLCRPATSSPTSRAAGGALSGWRAWA